MSFRVVFMGTPDFAVASLNAIIKSNIDVVGVITAPDKPAGRGKKMHSSAVKTYAIENSINTILQPTNLKDPDFINELKGLGADLFVVVAFRMLPEIVWAMPKFGTINLHASLLPNYRGAAPINWAIINGEEKTGVTSFFIEKDIDTGKIIKQQEVYIDDIDSAGTLHDKLMITGALLLVDTIKLIELGEAKEIPQLDLMNDNGLTSAPKIFKEDCKIDWKQPAIKVYNFIRGLSPYPAAWTEFCSDKDDTLLFKIFNAEIEQTNILLTPGKIDYSEAGTIKIACSDAFIKIYNLQQAGKKRMDTKAFLLGFANKESYNSAT
jgi:methionyl-tRNA formyltransferase